MPGLLPDVDSDGLLEYSVVFTDRALNHMSQKFQRVMRDVSSVLKEVYRARSAIVVPGSGTFGMEAVVRQFAVGKKTLVIRNGWFSYRWSQIIDAAGIAGDHQVLKARPVGRGPQAPYAPPPIDEVVAAIRTQRPDLVFAPHVETSSGLWLPDDYLKRVADTVHACGGMFVLDAIASGALWVDMQTMGVDILVSAPQKGWSGSPCCAFVMLGERARGAIDATASNSFAVDLKKWLQIAEAYEGGGHAYHATMPTDALAATRDAMLESRGYGFEKLRAEQWDLGRQVRALLARHGLKSVAADGFQAPGVVVAYTDDAAVATGKAFVAHGLQTAAGVPLQCDEGSDFRTFRIGLFGLDKLHDPARSVAALARALEAIAPVAAAAAATRSAA